MEGVPDKKGKTEFKLETILTTQIVSTLCLHSYTWKGDIWEYKYKTAKRRGTRHNTHQHTWDEGQAYTYSIGSHRGHMRDLALPSFSPSSYSRKKTMLPSTMCGGPCRQVNDNKLGYLKYCTRVILIYNSTLVSVNRDREITFLRARTGVGILPSERPDQSRDITFWGA